MIIDEFYKAPKDLLSCKGFVGKDGELVTLNSTAKLVMVYMIDRMGFFNGLTGRHYETQETIGASVGVEVKAAANALRQLVDGGAIIAKKIRNLSISPHLCWYYMGVNPELTLVAGERERKTTRASRKGKNEMSVTEEDLNWMH